LATIISVFLALLESEKMMSPFFSMRGMRASHAACPANVKFFLFKNDFLETNYLRIYWTDFHQIFTMW